MKQRVKRHEKHGADRTESRGAVPGVDGNLLPNTGGSVVTTCSLHSREDGSAAARC